MMIKSSGAVQMVPKANQAWVHQDSHLVNQIRRFTNLIGRAHARSPWRAVIGVRDVRGQHGYTHAYVMNSAQGKHNALD